MNNTEKNPVYNDEDHEFLGYVANDGFSWQALTIFGHQISLTTTREEAEAILRERGLTYLQGVWQYFDKDDNEWFPCVISEAYDQKVVVNRTNSLGYEEPDDRKQVTIEHPTENSLIKSS